MPSDHRYDYLVLGSGIAGLTFALRVAEKGSVAVITKKNRAESNTNYAQGGIACVTSTEDTFDLHVRDTLEAGAGLCREAVVRGIVEEGPARIKELIELGMSFTERENGRGHELDLGREGGHSKRRILHAKDVTGREIESALLTALALHPNVEMFENHAAIDLITRRKLGFATENRCVGVYVLDNKSGRVETVAARHVLLATGGCGKVYLYTTNPDIATGDGVAMAYRAGVPVANMEFIQFHPTCLFHPKAKSFLISEAVRGEGGILRNGAGKAFMDGVHPLASLAPRDIVARAIDAEIKRTGAEPLSGDLREVHGIWHRYGPRADSGGARRALSMRRRGDDPGGPHRTTGAVGRRRSRMHGFAWRESSGQQFAAGGAGRVASRGR
jgi:L-aspartate oxidase